MDMNFRLIGSSIITILLISCSLPKTDLTPDQTTVRKTVNGQVIGGDNGKTHQWLGIQYGSIPDGSYRWRKAKTPDYWEGVKEALDFGPTCVQRGSLINTTKRRKWGNMVGSEDCLYLNIWAPKINSEHLKTLTPMPVMLWIHGGSNVSGNADIYDPTVLALEHQLIVVTINYRLGPFGWFRHPSIGETSNNAVDASGNYGNIDTIQALEWVRSNISGFGGDPENVTIFGESAGGYNVAALLSSPMAKDLFHKAIIQSGGIKPGDITHSESYLSENLPWKNYTSKELMNRLLIRKKIARNREEAVKIQSSMNDDEVTSMLRSVSTEDIFESFENSRMNTNDMLRPFPDGVVLDEQGILTALENGASSEIPTIFGTNRDEIKLFLVRNKRLIRSFFGLPRIRDLQLWNAISSHRSDTWKYLAVDNPVRQMSLLGRQNVYAYRFDWDEEPRKYGVELSDLLGASHAFEIPFVMGNFEEDTLTRYILSRKNMEDVKALSGVMMSYWAEFAYTGDPGRGRQGNQLQWKSWDETSSESPKFIVLDSQSDQGITMSSNSITRDSLFSGIADDPNILDDKMRCELVDIAIKYDNVATEDWLNKFSNGLCEDLDPDIEWRHFWYDELDKPY